MNIQTAAAPATAKGPLVWRDMDQEALDNAYDQAVYAPNRDVILKRIAAATAQARTILGAPRRAAYGEGEHEGLDIFRAASFTARGAAEGSAPIVVFVHGGAWRLNQASGYAFLAEPLVRAGAHAVVLDFTTVDATGGDLMPLYRQVSRALGWVWRNAGSFGGDCNRLYILAHSSGAHLAACALTRGWREEGLAADFCKGAVLCSGMYDLEPVRLSKRSAYVKFTDGMEQALSAQRHIDGLTTPLILAYGTAETPEFQRQTRDFCAAVRAAGKPAKLIVAEGYNHFEMLEMLGNPYSLVSRAVLGQMGFA